jgi:hypothetical protein
MNLNIRNIYISVLRNVLGHLYRERPIPCYFGLNITQFFVTNSRLRYADLVSNEC